LRIKNKKREDAKRFDDILTIFNFIVGFFGNIHGPFWELNPAMIPKRPSSIRNTDITKKIRQYDQNPRKFRSIRSLARHSTPWKHQWFQLERQLIIDFFALSWSHRRLQTVLSGLLVRAVNARLNNGFYA